VFGQTIYLISAIYSYFNKNCNTHLRDHLHQVSRLFIWYHIRSGLSIQHKLKSRYARYMGKWSTHLRCYIPLGRKRFPYIVRLSHNTLWTVLLVSRGKHGVSCYCIEDCYNSNSTCVGNGPQSTSRTCDCLQHYSWDVQTTPSKAPTSRPVTSIYLGSFRSTCLAFDS